MYIRATGNISPQKTFGHPSVFEAPLSYTGNRLHCAEPDYKEIIDIKLIRRMSRIIKMGVASAMECLQEAGATMPDAIITGTAYGCLEDTGHFISRMIEHNEELLTPTAFIQSTHNTIGAQIGLMLQCNNYNNAFVHRGFSFESALVDAIMLLKEKEAANVLVGGIDEITDISHTILSRLGLYKRESISSINLFASSSKGTIAGEGAAFFLLTDQPSATDYAKLDAITTFYKPVDENEIGQNINSFLSENNVDANDIDLVITGRNGDLQHDRIDDRLAQTVFKNIRTVNYKQLCGEYPTSIAFALWMAAHIIKTGILPFSHDDSAPAKTERILIHNNYQGIHHSLLLLSAC
jgi:3-oxoacyl-(acyl-carrier-protein) synthase